MYTYHNSCNQQCHTELQNMSQLCLFDACASCHHGMPHVWADGSDDFLYVSCDNTCICQYCWVVNITNCYWSLRPWFFLSMATYKTMMINSSCPHALSKNVCKMQYHGRFNLKCESKYWCEPDADWDAAVWMWPYSKHFASRITQMQSHANARSCKKNCRQSTHTRVA